MKELKCTRLQFGLWFCMGVKLGLLILREEHRLRVFENRVLRKIFGPNRDEVMGRWRKLHNKELRELYSSPCTLELSSPGG
jgi:hypothetical protein